MKKFDAGWCSATFAWFACLTDDIWLGILGHWSVANIASALMTAICMAVCAMNIRRPQPVEPGHQFECEVR